MRPLTRGRDFQELLSRSAQLETSFLNGKIDERSYRNHRTSLDSDYEATVSEKDVFETNSFPRYLLHLVAMVDIGHLVPTLKLAFHERAHAVEAKRRGFAPTYQLIALRSDGSAEHDYYHALVSFKGSPTREEALAIASAPRRNRSDVDIGIISALS